MRGIWGCGVTLCLCVSLARATDPPVAVPETPRTAPLTRQFVKNLVTDQKNFWTRPAHITRGQAGRVVLFTVATAAFIATDRYSSGALPKGQVNVSQVVSDLGAGLFGLGAVGFFTVGKLAKNDHAEETGFLAAEALVDSLVVSQAIKLVAQRERPYEGKGHGRFFVGGASFPSGHSFLAFSAAEVIASEYHNRPLVRIGAYGLATLVALSRFSGKQHFPSDVFAGSAGGLLIGRYVWRAHHDAARKWSVIPIAGIRTDPRTRTYALTLTWGSAGSSPVDTRDLSSSWRAGGVLAAAAR